MSEVSATFDLVEATVEVLLKRFDMGEMMRIAQHVDDRVDQYPSPRMRAWSVATLALASDDRGAWLLDAVVAERRNADPAWVSAMMIRCGRPPF